VTQAAPPSPILIVEARNGHALLVPFDVDVSALARLEREGSLDGPSMVDALERLDALVHAWQEVQPIARIRQTAIRLLRVHGLRGADALQLGAALAVAEDQPASLQVVTLDDRLGQAAEGEGFRVVNPDRGGRTPRRADAGV
jgi:predicted nucleic acid-binding protein